MKKGVAFSKAHDLGPFVQFPGCFTIFLDVLWHERLETVKQWGVSLTWDNGGVVLDLKDCMVLAMVCCISTQEYGECGALGPLINSWLNVWLLKTTPLSQRWSKVHKDGMNREKIWTDLTTQEKMNRQVSVIFSATKLLWGFQNAKTPSFLTMRWGFLGGNSLEFSRWMCSWRMAHPSRNLLDVGCLKGCRRFSRPCRDDVLVSKVHSESLGGGFKYVLFSYLFGEDFQFD